MNSVIQDEGLAGGVPVVNGLVACKIGVSGVKGVVHKPAGKEDEPWWAWITKGEGDYLTRYTRHELCLLYSDLAVYLIEHHVDVLPMSRLNSKASMSKYQIVDVLRIAIKVANDLRDNHVKSASVTVPE